MKITTKPTDLSEGLFGQIFLFVFEVLPRLYELGSYPEWDIKSLYYGTGPDYTVIPGLLDLAYTPYTSNVQCTLGQVRDTHMTKLIGDWKHLSHIWHTYFRIPARTLSLCSQFSVTKSLGLHYRGTDKNLDNVQTNPVSEDDFITLVKDLLYKRPDIEDIFLATDEVHFGSRLSSELPNYRIRGLGPCSCWRDVTRGTEKGDRAIADCVLLSRCSVVLKCQSALSAFSKILNPNLEIYRCSASKLFATVPYFPDAYIRQYESNDKECESILDRLMKDDWLKS